MQTGIVSVTFRALAPEQVIALTKQAGLDGIEWGSDVHVPCGAGLRHAEHVGELTRAAGLSVLSLGSYFGSAQGTRAEQEPETLVQTARALGAPHIRIWAGGRGTAEATEDDWEQCIRKASALADCAAAEHIRVSFEYHPNTLTDEPHAACRLVERIARPNVGLYWQPNYFLDAEKNREALRLALPWLTNLHVFHWRETTRLPLAEGEALWRSFFAQVDAKAPHAALMEFVRDNDPAQFLEDAACLRRML